MIEFMRVHVSFLSHPKTIRATRRAGGPAVWLWLGLLAWMHQHDGEAVPSDCLDKVEGPTAPRQRAKALQALIDTGLVDVEGDGYAVHDFEHWSSEKSAFDARKYERERKRQQRKKTRLSRTVPDSPGHGPGHGPGLSPRAGVHASRTRDAYAHEDEDEDEDEDQEKTKMCPVSRDTSDSITSCPIDLLGRLPDQFWTELSEAYRTDRQTLERAAEEFVGYWTIGGGAGKARSNWPGRLREDLRRKHDQGRLRKTTGSRLKPGALAGIGERHGNG
jgi:hypothetical protein